MNYMEVIRVMNTMINNTRYGIMKNEINYVKNRIKRSYIIDKNIH